MSRSASALALAVLAALVAAFFLFFANEDTAPELTEREIANASDGEHDAHAARDDTASRREVDTDEADRVLEADAPSSAGQLRVRVRWHDDEPAADVAVRCRGYSSVLPGGTRMAVTDADGVAVFSGLGNQTLYVTCSRGGAVKATTKANEDTEAEIKIPKGLEVAGRVVDPDGAPVAGARIWLTTGYTDWLGGRVVARSGDDGHYRLRSVPDGQSLGAFRAGYLRSELVDLDPLDITKSPVQVDLVLRAGGASLQVLVVDEAGQPLEGARVAVGSMPRDFPSRSGGRNGYSQIETWTPLTITTDARGMATGHGLFLGELPVAARHEKTAIWKGKATTVAGRTATLRIELLRGVTVRGRVRGAYDKPIPAVVRIVDAEFDEVFLQSGQFDFEAVLGYPQTTCAQDGSYVLENVTPGTLHMHAQQIRRERLRREALFRAKKIVEARNGTTVEWNPILDAGPTIEGSVRYRCGTPLGGLFITAKDTRSGKSNVIHSAKDGSFRFINLERSTYDISVQLWRRPKGSKPVGEKGVVPGQKRVDLRTDFDAPIQQSPGGVVGELVDHHKRLAHAGALSLQLHSARNSWRGCRDFDGMRFQFKGIEPGRYRLAAKSGEDLIYSGDWLEVHPNAVRDVGQLLTEAAASLDITIDREPGTEDVEGKLHISPLSGAGSTTLEIGRKTALLHENLNPGKHKLVMWARDMAPARAELELRAGERGRVRLTLRPQFKIRITSTLPTGAPDGARLELEVLNAAKKSIWRWDVGLVAPLLPRYVKSIPIDPSRAPAILRARIGSWKKTEAAIRLAPGKVKGVDVELRW